MHVLYLVHAEEWDAERGDLAHAKNMLCRVLVQLPNSRAAITAGEGVEIATCRYSIQRREEGGGRGAPSPRDCIAYDVWRLM